MHFIIMFFDVTNTVPDRTKNPGCSNSLGLCFFICPKSKGHR